MTTASISPEKSHQRGFTLIEIIIVVMLAGIIAVIASVSMPNMGAIRLNMTAQNMQSDIRYAQSLAVSTQRWTQIIFSAAGDNYSIYIDGIDDGISSPSGWSIVQHPATKENATVQLNSGDFAGIDITALSLNGAANNLVFDRWGNPYAYSGSGAPAVLSNPAFIRLSASSGTVDVRIERGTGRVYIQ